MAPRKRKAENVGLPVGLTPLKQRGKQYFRYRYPDNKTDFIFPLGTTRQQAIEAATVFNMKYRNKMDLLELLESKDKYNKPLSHWLPKVRERFIKEERPGSSKLDRFDRNYKRVLNDFGNVNSKDWSLEHVNDYLSTYYSSSSNNEYNRALTQLAVFESYMMDMSAMTDSPSKRKKRKPKDKKARQRLSAENYAAMIREAQKRPELHYLYIAMRLTEQTTHAVNEITKIKYSDFKKLDEPINIKGLTVYGFLHIHRKKTQHTEESRVRIPVTQKLKNIVEESRDRVICPYVVHRAPDAITGEIAKGITHQFQLTPNYLSRAFSAQRDQMGLYDHLKPEQRPTYHEMRATAADALDKMDHDPQ
ncbi:phage integrase Arm DNA-binding domain-containing protein [Pseudoalteromonas obscura]|uniref:Phage integrase Arm DNA-binding domain-containing protein n=1 Tax=Pseudoalteromonas obscura TaxID=3048491 RepID=A0ABT7EGQ8_9GAMM|nr:phage integrase Arm DNA-binding domain-containing protein [Pseudoalteromonas sp. P94(2023)]MDK2594228.1 phage integrase Arm DNA-binding domain-containing protein [Pseudoalteromonas sp. P94(2023)]